MKIDDNRKATILGSTLKPEAAHAKDLPETDTIVSKSKDTIDKLELSTHKSTIDRSPEKNGMPSLLLKEQKNLDFIDKVELSTKKNPPIPTKEKEKTAITIISQDRINALLKTIKSETYNLKFGGATENMMKSQLLDIVI
jgi:hypothetical protein